jgi:hypothetical protein
MTQLISHLKKPFFIWLFANILGFGVLGIVALMIPYLGSAPGFFGSILVISIPISLAQWIALRRLFPISIFWVFSMPIFILLTILFIREIPNEVWEIADDESPIVFTVGYLLFGIFIALPQWLLLRRHCSNSSIWLLGSSLGVSLGTGIVFATNMINKSPISAYIIAVLVYSISTGLVLSWLVDRKDHSRSAAVAAT